MELKQVANKQMVLLMEFMVLKETKTDANGNYSFAVGPGTYSVSAEFPGLLPGMNNIGQIISDTEVNFVLWGRFVAFEQDGYHLRFDLHAEFRRLVVGRRLNLHVLCCRERRLLRQLRFNDILCIGWVRRLLVCLSHDPEVIVESLSWELFLVFC